MPKPNVDLVTLIAINELSQAVNPNKSWRLPASAPTVGNKIANWIEIETMGAIISEQIGSAVNRPDRVYQPGVDMPDGAEIVTDDDPLSPTFGQPVIMTDPYLDGLEYSVHVRGVEYMVKGQEWQNDIVGGGWRWTDGRIFQDGDVITVSFKPVISNILAAPDAVARFSNGIQVITADTILGPSFQRKVIFLNSATSTLSVTLDETYPENVLCLLLTATGTQKNTVIVAPAGQDIYLNGVVSSFVLGEVEHAQLIRIGTRWYVIDISDGWQRVGQVVMGGIPGPNVISANGQTLQIAERPRVNAYLDALEAELPGSVVSSVAWASDKTKWGRDTVGGIINVPQLGGWFPRFLDLGAGKDTDRSVGDRSIVASTQANQNKAHTHVNGEYGHLMRQNGQNTLPSSGDAGANQPNLLSSAEMLSNGGIESRPENVGLPALIYV